MSDRPSPKAPIEDPLQLAVKQFLAATGQPLDDPELMETPRRVAELWRREFLSGYELEAAEVLAPPHPLAESSNAVFIKNIAFHGMCPHHLMPLFGVAHLAYLPGKHITGFGRLARLVACCTQRLVLQERACDAIAQALMDHLGARGAGCVLEGKHLCLGIPDDRHIGNQVVTASFVGEMEKREDHQARLLTNPSR
ncbi:MAG: GTP cyclohydrolase I [Deltaproteobacteria bacterium]|nr:GTP cyclohydrolase I [Deltaproteobacteria bacterium]